MIIRRALSCRPSACLRRPPPVGPKYQFVRIISERAGGRAGGCPLRPPASAAPRGNQAEGFVSTALGFVQGGKGRATSATNQKTISAPGRACFSKPQGAACAQRCAHLVATCALQAAGRADGRRRPVTQRRSSPRPAPSRRKVAGRVPLARPLELADRERLAPNWPAKCPGGRKLGIEARSRKRRACSTTFASSVCITRSRAPHGDRLRPGARPQTRAPWRAGNANNTRRARVI